MERSVALPIIGREADRILDLARGPVEDRTARLPTCPDWTFDDLLNHLGRVYAMVATVLGDETGEPPDREKLPRRPEGLDPADWVRQRLEILLPVLSDIPEDEPRWNFVEGPRSPARFWWRRQVHETMVHRVDAELGAGVPVSEPEPEIAVDGIRECLLIAGLKEVPWEDLPLGHGMTIHLHVADLVDAEWTIATADNGYAEAHLKADIAVRGPAWELDRWMWRRGSVIATEDAPEAVRSLLSLVDVEAFGDVRAAEEWRPRF